ncbi:MAG TPA: NADH-quinone oxidoreductase subunit N [Anaerolineales bacterium]|nr:NADH-quinone oxidoreductase subunit N [Anaerolineales bacterium]
MIGGVDNLMVQAILPEILLLVLIGVVLVLDLVLSKEKDRSLGWVTALGLALIIVISLVAGMPNAEGQSLWGGMVRFDWMGYVFKLVFLFAAAITALLSTDHKEVGQRGEFYLLMLASTIGMCLMASAGDLVMLYLAIETTSIPMYILAGFMTRDQRSTEAGFKYLLFGAFSSAVMLYGFSLLYGFAGTTSIYAIATGLQAGTVPATNIIACVLLMLVGFAFKISAVPFHFWAPDVYEGAPTPVAGFLSTASKAAGFAALMRVFLIAFPGAAIEWGAIATTLAVATMTLGNFLALAQKNLKRMLAYSSIAHAGYVLIGVSAIAVSAPGSDNAQFGISSVVFYLIAYLVTNLTAFGAIAVFERTTGVDDISAFNGMSRRSPGLALIMMVAMLSLAGMPPLAGFIAKFFVFAAAVKVNLVWLAAVGALNSIVGLYYYMTVLKYIYLYDPAEETPIGMTKPFKVALVILSVVIVLVGTVFSPIYAWSTAVAAGLF